MPQPRRQLKTPAKQLPILPLELQLMTPETVAQVLGTTVATLASWRFDQLGPSYVKVGALIRYPAPDLMAWLESRRVTTSALTTSPVTTSAPNPSRCGNHVVTALQQRPI